MSEVTLDCRSCGACCHYGGEVPVYLTDLTAGTLPALFEVGSASTIKTKQRACVACQSTQTGGAKPSKERSGFRSAAETAAQRGCDRIRTFSRQCSGAEVSGDDPNHKNGPVSGSADGAFGDRTRKHLNLGADKHRVARLTVPDLVTAWVRGAGQIAHAKAMSEAASHRAHLLGRQLRMKLTAPASLISARPEENNARILPCRGDRTRPV